jgi:Carboxypeptidase regulatory-like domain
MKALLFSLFAGIALFAMSSGNIWAQATAQIAGTVKDQTGAVLPGVEVTAAQNETGITRMSVTNETGSFVLANLPIGTYRLSAALPGFKTYAQTGVVLDVNSSPVINPVLEVGQVAEQVEVQANAALVDTRTSGVGQVMENTRILDLPLNGRAMIDLVSLSGAATPAPILDGSGGRDPFTKGNVSVAGGLNTGLNTTLDGAYHNNPYTNGYMSMPFPDALQEFKVETGATSAQNGLKSSGTVSLVTKSGTNDIHGDAFEFVRNGIFNARNSFATKRDTIKRNQFGGTVGGPIEKNKLFFFAGYQGTTFRQDPADTIAFVPTAPMLAGDFATYASPACNSGRPLTLRGPFVNNRVDPKLFSQPAVTVAGKLPSSSDPCGKTIFGMPPGRKTITH